MPTWSKAKCSPIALDDAVAMLVRLINREVQGHEIFEIGSEVMGYDELVTRSGAIARKKKNGVIYTKLFPIAFAAYIVRILTGVPTRIAYVLMGSLKNDSMVTNNRFAEIVGREPIPIDKALTELHKQIQRREKK
jgi:nucleoside-diphosphate-sugar epimerase